MKLYHKCTVAGAMMLFEEFQVSPICTSSEVHSNELFWRDVVLVLDVPERNILKKSLSDIDSRGDTPYDEVRILFETVAELEAAAVAIILDGKRLRKIKNGNYISSEAAPGTLSTQFFDGRDHQKADSLATKFFFENVSCEVLNLAQAKKKNRTWDRQFLNIY